MQSFRNRLFQKLFYLSLVGFSYLLLISACKKEEDDPKEETPVISTEDSIYYVTHDIMKNYYLWYEEIPEDIDIYSYSNPDDLMKALRYEEYDRWSAVIEASVLESTLQTGESNSIGFRMRWNTDNTLRILNVYKESGAARDGLRKGDNITKINGISVFEVSNATFYKIQDGSPGVFTFRIENANESPRNVTIIKEEINLNAVLHSQIDTIAQRKVGYIVYDGFTEYSESELDEVFSNFHQNDIDELVVDLRYNGGGYVYLAIKLCEMIAPTSAVGQEMFSYSWNDVVAPELDTTIKFASHEYNLDLDRVFFITTEYSASASEMVINSLTPHMDVYLIGGDTHGKPVGMPTIPFQDYYILPVAFKTTNASGYGDYFNGLSVDQSCDEGLSYDWGDLNEPNLAHAHHYIENGYFKHLKSIESEKKSTHELPNIKPYEQSFMIIK